MDTLFAPLPPLAPHLVPYRFWIWLQVVALRIYVRALKGRGVPFLTRVDRYGTVHLLCIGDAPRERTANPFDSFTPSRAFRMAMTGEDQAFGPAMGRRTPPCRFMARPCPLTGTTRRSQEPKPFLPVPDT